MSVSVSPRSSPCVASIGDECHARLTKSTGFPLGLANLLPSSCSSPPPVLPPAPATASPALLFSSPRGARAESAARSCRTTRLIKNGLVQFTPRPSTGHSPAAPAAPAGAPASAALPLALGEVDEGVDSKRKSTMPAHVRLRCSCTSSVLVLDAASEVREAEDCMSGGSGRTISFSCACSASSAAAPADCACAASGKTNAKTAGGRCTPLAPSCCCCCSSSWRSTQSARRICCASSTRGSVSNMSRSSCAQRLFSAVGAVADSADPETEAEAVAEAEGVEEEEEEEGEGKESGCSPAKSRSRSRWKSYIASRIFSVDCGAPSSA